MYTSRPLPVARHAERMPPNLLELGATADNPLLDLAFFGGEATQVPKVDRVRNAFPRYRFSRIAFRLA